MSRPPESPGRHHLALVGLMGAGKSAVGRELADFRGVRHVDLDVAVTAEVGRSIGVLFAELGEDGFRDAEQSALAGVLANDEPVVLSTGGGVLLREANRLVLADRAVVVWLRASPETLAGRVGDGVGRPLLQEGEPVEVLGELSVRRSPAYEAAADVVVETDDLSVGEVADKVMAALPDPVPT